MPDRTRVAATVLLAAQAAWAAAGFVFPGLPGWTMFSKVERAHARLIDGKGVALDLYGLLPRDVYLVDKRQTRLAAKWHCAPLAERGPWTLEWADGSPWEDPCPKR